MDRLPCAVLAESHQHLHHKTGASVLHPLEEQTYGEAQEVLAQLQLREISMILREIAPGKAKPYAFSSMQHIVQRMRKKLKLPSTSNLMRAGMTELDEAERTDGQGRTLAAHRTQQSYEGYAKRNLTRALPATRRGPAHKLAKEATIVVQGGRKMQFRLKNA